METFLITLMIALSLSMDAFSLSLSYGMSGIEKKKIVILSIIVGLFHFFMPLIGFFIGHNAIEKLILANNIIIFVILFAIGIEMIVSSLKHKNNIKILNLIGMLFFGFAVSMDSFAIGVGLKIINPNIFLTVFLFAIISFLFTYFGLILGKLINKKIEKYATIIGGFILIFISIIYLLGYA